MKQKINVGTIWSWEHFRAGKLIDSWIDRNMVTKEGLTYLLNVGFKSGTPITAWYLLTFEDDYTPDGDETYAVPVFIECADIDEVARPAWISGAIVVEVLDNSANKATFTYNASALLNIYGGALVGGGTAADTIADVAGGGTMYCVSRFTSGTKEVEPGDVLKVTVTLVAQNA